MTNKLCPKCKQDKPVQDFSKNKRKRDGLSSWCKACSYPLKNDWFSKPENRARHKAKLYERRLANKQRLIDYFGSKCNDCGNAYPVCVYDFHHLDSTQKEDHFGNLSTHSWKVIEKEIIGKCVMLCSNCHRIRHHANE